MENQDMFKNIRNSYEDKGTILVNLEDNINPFSKEDIDKLKVKDNYFKGELTIIISNQNNIIKKINKEKIVNKAKKYLKKYSLKDTVDLILETEKINKKKVYDLCLKIKNEKN